MSELSFVLAERFTLNRINMASGKTLQQGIMTHNITPILEYYVGDDILVYLVLCYALCNVFILLEIMLCAIVSNILT